MRSLLLILAAIFSAPAAKASDLVLVHARVYTTPNAAPIADGSVLIHDGKIVAVGTSVKTPKGATTIDCTGRTITAGFWNSHVHILTPTLLHADQHTPTALNAELQTMFTRWGFTSVFDIASVLANTNYIRKQIATGTLIGPRILTTGEPFFGPGGTPIYVKQYLIDQHVEIPEATSAAQARERVDQEVKDGADGIKIFAGSIEPEKILMLPDDIAHAVVAEAHKDHRLVFSHPSSIKGVELSLDSGADILAHVSSFEGPWPQALVERMKAAHMSLIPTLTLFHVEMQKAGASAAATDELIGLAVRQLHSYSSVGGQILFGTDIGYIDHYDTTEEFSLMARAGMTFPQILASMTTAPASRYGYGSHSGRIAAGYDADLVVLEADPAADLTALAKVAYTIRAGRIIYQAQR